MLLGLPTATLYNSWANNRIYNACGSLTDTERKGDRRAFFKSIHRTLNDVSLADFLYRQRLENQLFTSHFLMKSFMRILTNWKRHPEVWTTGMLRFSYIWRHPISGIGDWIFIRFRMGEVPCLRFHGLRINQPEGRHYRVRDLLHGS